MSEDTIAVADRRTQRAAVVEALHAKRMSRTALVEHFGVSSSLITRLVRSLIDDGVVRELDAQTQAIGRPPIRLEIDQRFGSLIAASATTFGVHARAVNLHGAVIGERHLAAERIAPEGIVEAIGALAARTPRLLGIGLAVPGIVDTDTGEVSAAPDLGWTDPVPLREMLRERFGVVVSIDNDVNLMMLAEQRALAERAARNAVYVYLGAHGVGAGLIAGGSLITGSHGAAGEIGLLPARGTAGAEHLEDAISTTALAARLRAAGHSVEGPVIPRLLELAAAGDPVAIPLRAELLAALCDVTTTIAALLDPEAIVFGGEAGSLGPAERAEIERRLAARIPFHPALLAARTGADDLLGALHARCWSDVLAGGL